MEIRLIAADMDGTLLDDENSLALDAADALAFTLALLRAHTAADRRKCGGFSDHLCSLSIVSFCYFFYKCRTIDLDRASLNASRIFAV